MSVVGLPDALEPRPEAVGRAPIWLSQELEGSLGGFLSHSTEDRQQCLLLGST